MTKYDAGKRLKSEIWSADLDQILKDAGAMVAGGAFLSIMENREINDIDVFFTSKEVVDKALDQAREYPGFKIIYNNPTACMFTMNGSLKFNFIKKKRFFNSLEELFADFDFTCTMIGFSCIDWNVRCHYGFDYAYVNLLLDVDKKDYAVIASNLYISLQLQQENK